MSITYPNATIVVNSNGINTTQSVQYNYWSTGQLSSSSAASRQLLSGSTTDSRRNSLGVSIVTITNYYRKLRSTNVDTGDTVTEPCNPVSYYFTGTSDSGFLSSPAIPPVTYQEFTTGNCKIGITGGRLNNHIFNLTCIDNGITSPTTIIFYGHAYLRYGDDPNSEFASSAYGSFFPNYEFQLTFIINPVALITNSTIKYTSGNPLIFTFDWTYGTGCSEYYDKTSIYGTWTASVNNATTLTTVTYTPNGTTIDVTDTFTYHIKNNSSGSILFRQTVTASSYVPTPSLYYPMNIGDANRSNQLINWGSGSASYDANINSSYISTANYQCGVGSVEFPKNIITGFGIVTKLTVTVYTLSIAVSQNQLKMITSDWDYVSLRSKISYRKRTAITSAWSNPVQILGGDTTKYYYRCGLNRSATRGVACQPQGYVYFFSWTGDVPDATMTRTLETVPRSYIGVAITSDGLRMVVSADSYIFFATWNGTNYTAFQQTLNTQTISSFINICVSDTGDRIVYANNGSGNWYISFWNGTNYNDGKLFKSDSVNLNIRCACFSTDASILFLSYYQNLTGSISYGKYNPALNTYDTFTYIPTTLIPAFLDMHAMCFVDGTTYGFIYCSGWGYLDILCLPVSYSYKRLTGYGTLVTPIVTPPYSTYGGISVSQNQLKMILSGDGSQQYLYYSTRANTVASWSAPLKVGTVGGIANVFFFKCYLTPDGTRGVVASYDRNGSSGGRLYFFDWTAATPGELIVVTGSTSIWAWGFRGVTLTPDASILVASSDSRIYFSKWNSSITNYSSLASTLEASTGIWGQICISGSGDRIVYGDNTNSGTGSWRISFWNGTNFAQSTIFRTLSGQSPRSAFFNPDASILFLSYYNNPTGSVEYGYYDPVNTTYSIFYYIPVSYIPAGIDAHGLGYVEDGEYNGYIYVSTWGTNTTYYLPIAIRPILSETSATQTKFVSLPTLQTSTEGYSITTWFRSNNNVNLSRLIDFGTQTGSSTLFQSSDCLVVSIGGNSDGTGYLLYGVTNGTDRYTNPNLISSSLINDNKWYHLAITSTYVADPGSATSNVIIYLNGVVISNTSNQFFYPNTNIVRTTNYLGKSNWSNDPPFYGNVDDFRFFNSVLTSSDVSKIYSNDSTINSFVNYRSYNIYKPQSVTVDIVGGSNSWGASTNMGTTTYYYWYDPSLYSYTNYPNPVVFTYTYNNTTNLTNAKLYVMIDDLTSGILVNEIDITSSVDIGYGGARPATTINLVPGYNYFQFGCINSGGRSMFAAYVTDMNGAFLFNTNATYTGWTAKLAGFFYQNIPLTAYIRNNHLVNSTAALTTNYTVNTGDINRSGAVSSICPYNKLGYAKNNSDIKNIFYT
jgi:hypothetical protein